MRKLLLIAAMLLSLVTVASAQNASRNAAAVGYSGLDYGINKGVSGSVQRTIYRYDKVKVDGIAEATAFFYDGQRIYTLQAGPQVSADLFEAKLALFARLLYGASKDGRYYDYAHAVGVGLDVNVTDKLFIRGSEDRQSFANGAVGYKTTFSVGLHF